MSKKVVGWFNTTAFGHPAQDAWASCSFSHEGRTVVIGAIADGASGDINDADYEPELGAIFLTRQFINKAQALYADKGLRGKQLGEGILLHLGFAMRELVRNVSFEQLSSTLLGFIADDEHLVQVLCGDGCVSLNGDFHALPDGRTYPVEMLNYSPSLWLQMMRDNFTVDVTPMDQVRSLVLATDGLNREESILESIDRWDASQQNAQALIMDLDSTVVARDGYRDDITVLALSVNP